MHTDVQRPAKATLLFPVLLNCSITRASSHVFIVVRSITLALGCAALISWNLGPEKVFSATVGRMVGTLKMRAAWATRAALLRSMTASIDRVANAICDW